MKKLSNSFIGALCFVVTSAFFLPRAHSQALDSRQEWASRVVNLQQGPELNRLIEQLAGSTTQDLIQNWGPKIDADVPAAKQASIRDALNLELQRYSDDVIRVISSKATMVSRDTLVSAYAERFTVDELKQIASFFDSPAIKKYQAATPELSNVFVQGLIDATRADVTARMTQFNESAGKIVSSGATPKASQPPSSKAKPASKP